jgi:hypothetical protein
MQSTASPRRHMANDHGTHEEGKSSINNLNATSTTIFNNLNSLSTNSILSIII